KTSLETMCKELSTHHTIAVDCEYAPHYDSLIPFISLIQMSTKRHTYLIDPLLVWDCLHEYLQPIFADPTIMKVFFCGVNDILGLQRDFQIFCVGVVDAQELAMKIPPYKDIPDKNQRKMSFSNLISHLG